MAENGVVLGDGPVIGVALDGLGWGADQTIWGGEFLLADYRAYRRLACLKPVAMPGGAQAIREPWRNAYAQIVAAMGWARFRAEYGDTELFRYLAAKPLQVLDGMIARRVNAPLASSCGRLFDAVAAAAGIRPDRAKYEGQAAMELEACTDKAALAEADGRAYPFAITRSAPDGLLHLDPTPLWPALLDDVAAGAPARMIGARFHRGLATAIVDVIDAMRAADPTAASAKCVALSGGVVQNRVLLELLVARLEVQGNVVLTHREVPANDGGLALGQAAIAAARMIQPH